MEDVATMPVDRPRFDNCSTIVGTAMVSLSTPIAPLYVFTPAEKTVAPAAESVTKSLPDEVLLNVRS